MIEGYNVCRHTDLMTHNHGSVAGNTATWYYLDKKAEKWVAQPVPTADDYKGGEMPDLGAEPPLPGDAKFDTIPVIPGARPTRIIRPPAAPAPKPSFWSTFPRAIPRMPMIIICPACFFPDAYMGQDAHMEGGTHEKSN